MGLRDELISFVATEVTESGSQELETIRRIRNATRMYMTRDRSLIQAWRQQQWWAALDHTTNRLLAFTATGLDPSGVAWSTTAGYGLCRLIDDKWWVSGALDEDFQGVGLGKLLFGTLVDTTGVPCWLEVLQGNTRAMRTYKALGFVEVSRDGDVTTMAKR